MIQNKQTIIITGGLGFIFSWVTEYFVKKGYRVIVIDNVSTGSHPEIINNSFEFINMDVSDEKIIEVIKKINPTYIIHAAANSDVDTSIKNPLFVIKQNALGNMYIIEAARRLSALKKFLYISTDEVYGECYHKKIEDEIIFPRNPYACSKAMGSLLRITFDNSYPELKNKTTETRFCNIFGPRQDSRKIIPHIINSIQTKQLVDVHNGGLGSREYLYVENIPLLIEKILLYGTRTYNITNNDRFTVNELIVLIEKLTHKRIYTTKGLRPGMDSVYQMDSNRVRQEFNWKPIVSFEEGIKRLLKAEKLL